MKEESVESKLKHLEFLQGAIARMDHNSFLIRGWIIGLVSGLFALAAAEANRNYVLISYLGIPAFWLLDGFYLSQERCFRSLYETVSKQAPGQIDFSMDCKPFNIGRNTWQASLLSPVLLAFYGTTLSITLIVMFLF